MFKINEKLTEDLGLSKDELERYSRQLVMPEVGIEGQKKLKSASVLVVGMGGLGAPIGMYLAAAGVGKLGLVDFDVVSFSNLQRQIIYSTEDVGKPKAELAERKLKAINSEVSFKTHNLKLTSENAFDIIGEYDIIADGTDNFAAKYLINDACVLLGKPYVYGSILKFEGQASFFNLPESPCYRCLYPQPPEPGSVPSCEEGGVLGVLPGIIGSIQANEIIKYILGKGDLLTGRLLMFDALKMKFKELIFVKNLHCPICGANPSITKLLDYEEICQPVGGNESKELQNKNINVMNENTNEITVEELKQKIDNKEKFFLLDVREPFEKQIADMGGVLIPMNSIPQRLDELNKEDEIIVYCHTGNRSHYAAKYLRQQGFMNVKNLVGGINAWSEKIDTSIPKY